MGFFPLLYIRGLNMQRQCFGAGWIGCRSRSRSFHQCSEPWLTHIAVFTAKYHHVPAESPSRITPLYRLSLIGTEALMEILGLDPYQSETQYLDGKLRAIGERQQRVNLLLACDGSVAAFSHQSRSRGNKGATCCRFKTVHV